MKWWAETIGIIVLIQGVGGLLNKLLDGSGSWFLVRHWVPDALQIPACVVLIVIGGALLLKTAATKEKA
jgi:hypothetical protein